MANNKNINIIADGLAGDSKGNVLGYNNTPNGYIAPVIGKSERNSNASYIDKDGVMKIAPPNQLRVDYTNGVAEILLEPTSTNLITYSQKISEWDNNMGGGNEVVTDNYLISPDGTQNASRIQTTLSNAGKTFLIQDTTTSSFTYSGYIKHLSLTTVYSIRGTSGINGYVSIDVSTLEVVGDSGGWGALTTLKQFPNGWVYFQIKEIPRVSSSAVRFWSSSQLSNYGNQDFGFWGAQVEALDYATSYIPTNGTTITRLADSLTDFGVESIINSDEGMLVFEGSALVDRVGDRRFDISQDGQGANRLYLSFNTSTKGFAISCSRNGSTIFYSSFGDFFNPYDQTVNRKIIIQYNSSGVIVYFDGVEVFSRSIDSSLQNINKMEFKNINQYNFFGRVRQYRHLPYNTDITTV